MKKNYFGVLLFLAVISLYVTAQPATAAGQGTWSEKPPGAERSKPQKDDKGAGAADRQSIERLLRQQLQSDPALSSVSAEVDSNAVVTLTGNVATKNDRDHAKQLAESVPGVRKVKDKIKIGVSASGPQAQNSKESTANGNTAGSIAGNTEAHSESNSMARNNTDQTQSAIQTQVQKALRSEATLSPSVAQNIAVNAVNNHVVLSGTVPTQADKDKAQQVAL